MLLEDLLLLPSEDEVGASAAMVNGNTGQSSVALISLPKLEFGNVFLVFISG